MRVMLSRGGGYGREKLSALRGVKIDGHLVCSDDDAAAAARSLAIHEGILAGYSTGAQLHAATELLRSRERGEHDRLFSLRHRNEISLNRALPLNLLSEITPAEHRAEFERTS